MLEDALVQSYKYLDTSAVADLLLIVYLVTSLMLAVVNLYTLCILHKNGCCFMYRLSMDVEEEAATVTYSKRYVTVRISDTMTVSFGPSVSQTKLACNFI